MSVVAALLLLAPTAAQAQALACKIPDRIPVPQLEQPKRGEPVRRTATTGYLLSISWSPQHCADVRNPRDVREWFQCAGENGRFGWVLHGLWPETDSADYPQWCRPAQIVSQAVLREHLCITPSAQLLQNEWAKHGTCMSPHPAAYFRSAAILFRAVRFPDMAALAAKHQTAGSIRRAFAATNAGVTAPMIAVTTDQQGWLKEVRLCLGPRMRPQRCKPFQVGARDARTVRVRPMAED